MANRPLSDDEVCKKFKITPDHPGFDYTKSFANSGRPDRIICDMPECACPHCGHEWQAEGEDYADAKDNQEWTCPSCERTFWAEHVELSMMITFSTHDPRRID